MIVGTIWPHAATAIKELVEEKVLPAVIEGAKAYINLEGMEFKTFSLGSVSPQFGPVSCELVTDSENRESLEVKLDINYKSDLEILLDTGKGVQIGIKGIGFSGQIHVLMSPMLDQLPLVGGVQIYFTSPPEVDFEFEGIVNIPGLEPKLKQVIKDVLTNELVLPNKVFVQLASSAIIDVIAASASPPIGILTVQARAANNIPGVNWAWGDVENFTSDPYAKYSLGGHKLSFKCHDAQNGVAVLDTNTPTWIEDTEANIGRFVVYAMDQSFKVSLENQEQAKTSLQNIVAPKMVSYLGECAEVSIKDIENSEFWEFDSSTNKYRATLKLDTENVAKGMLHANDPVNNGKSSSISLTAQWLSLSRQPAANISETSIAVLFVKLKSARNIPLRLLDEKDGVRVEFSLKGPGGEKPLFGCREQTVLSKRGKLADDNDDGGGEGDVRGGIYGQLARIVDKLIDKGMDTTNIGDVIGRPTANVDAYINWKATKRQREIERKKREHEAEGEASYNEVIPLYLRVSQMKAASLKMLMFDGKKQLLGVKEVPLAQLTAPEYHLPNTPYSINAPQVANSNGGFFSSMFNPTCGPAPSSRSFRVDRIEVDVSIDTRFLEPTAIPNGSDAEEAVDWEQLQGNTNGNSNNYGVGKDARVSFTNLGGGEQAYGV